MILSLFFHVNASELRSEILTQIKHSRGPEIRLLLGASASYIINANCVILSVPEFYFLIFQLAVLFRLNESRSHAETRVPLFLSLRTAASLLIHLISSVLTSASSSVLLSNSP